MLDTKAVVEEVEEAEANGSAINPDAGQQTDSQPPPLPGRPTFAITQALDTSSSKDVIMADNTTPLVDVRDSSKPSSVSSSTAVDETEQPLAYSDNNLDSGLGNSTDPSSREDSQRPSTDWPMGGLDPPNMAGDKQPSGTQTPLSSDHPSFDGKVLKALETQKRSSGTDQQDVEEVIGSIVNLLQSAIQYDREDPETEIQYEKIMENFFVTTVDYTKDADQSTYSSKVSYGRSITAYPSADGESDLHDGIAVSFDQEVFGDDQKARYSSIRTLPPILHVLIQRATYGTKNDNPVLIPETLYLDRYMDRDQQSPEFQRRKREWALARRVKDLKKFQADMDGKSSGSDTKTSEPDKTSSSGDGQTLEKLGKSEKQSAQEDVSMSDAPVEVEPVEEDWTFDGPVEDEFLLINPVEPTDTEQSDNQPKPTWEGYHDAEERINEMRSEDWIRCRTELNKSYDTTKDHGYRLEAVICHQGRMTAGHYWVWIRDFEDNVWRLYNDSTVTVYADEEEVFEKLNSKGDPYYLCYVRDKDKQNWVSVPKRESKDEVQIDPQD